MFKNETDKKINMYLLVALQALYGIRIKYDETKDKDGFVEDLTFFLDFCDYHKLLEYDIRLKHILILLVEKENLIPWLKERIRE